MPATDSSRHPEIYRAILKKRWYDVPGRQVLPVAFHLKEKDEGKLSVLKSVNCLPGGAKECTARMNECYGEFVLETTRVLSLGLGVHDDDPSDPQFSENHASIIGIPENPATDDEVRRRNDLYSRLAEMARLHYDRDGRYA
jgi:hypothetical protein